MLTILPTIWRPGFTAAVCERWNVSDKYTWDNAGDLKQLSMDQTFSEDNRSDKGVFYMVTHAFDNSNLSQESFAIDTWGAVICSLGHGRKYMLMMFQTIWRPGLRLNAAVCALGTLSFSL